MRLWTRAGLLVIGLLHGGTALAGEAEDRKPPPEVAWQAGPAAVDVGSALAHLQLPEGFAWANARDAKKLLQWMGNPTNGSEMGMVIPSTEGDRWFVILEWDPMGYVKDDDKEKIDADAILSSVREATEEGNEERKKMGGPGLHVTGWAEPPHYDQRTHNLTWAIQARDDEGDEVVNHNVRLLGRSGVMSITLVDSPARLATSRPQVDRIVEAFSYKPGKTYAEWVPGDKVAEYGLTALVAAGAGAAAVKLGFFAFLAKLLAKMGKAIVAVVVGLGVAAKRFWNSLRGKAEARAPRMGTLPPPPSPPAAG